MRAWNEGRRAPRVGKAMGRRWYVVVLAVAAAAVIALAAVTVVPVRYRAEARLLVTAINVKPEALPGATAAAATLAGTYSRLLGTTDVMTEVAKAMGQPPGRVAARVSASPIPDSSIIRVAASGDTPEEATALADAAARALSAYVQRLTTAPAEPGVLDRYDAATKQLLAAQASQAQKQAEATQAAAGKNPQAAVAALVALQEAQAATARAQLTVDALAEQYKQSVGGAPASALLQPLGAARAAGDNQAANRQAALLAGILVGVGLGAVVSLALEWRAVRRAPAPAQAPLPRPVASVG